MQLQHFFLLIMIPNLIEIHKAQGEAVPDIVPAKHTRAYAPLEKMMNGSEFNPRWVKKEIVEDNRIPEKLPLVNTFVNAWKNPAAFFPKLNKDSVKGVTFTLLLK